MSDIGQRQYGVKRRGVARERFPFEAEGAPAFAAGPRESLGVLERQQREAIVLCGRDEFRRVEFIQARV